MAQGPTIPKYPSSGTNYIPWEMTSGLYLVNTDDSQDSSFDLDPKKIRKVGAGAS